MVRDVLPLHAFLENTVDIVTESGIKNHREQQTERISEREQKQDLMKNFSTPNLGSLRDSYKSL